MLLLLILAAFPQLTEPAFAAALARNAAIRRTAFVEAGLAPIEDAARQRRNLRRLRVSVWVPGRPPAMEIERHRDGKVTLLARSGVAAERHPLPMSTWRELVALDARVYAPPTFDSIRIGERPASVASCHGDTADFEAATAGRIHTVGADQCLPRIESFDPAKNDAIAIFVRIAITTRPQCTTADHLPANALTLCFQ